MPEYTILQCDHCPVRFATKSDLKRHKRFFGKNPKEHLGNYIDKHREMKGSRIIDLVLKYLGDPSPEVNRNEI